MLPRPLESYAELEGIGATLANRVREEPFNLVAWLIFLLAIVHTFLTPRFLAISHRWEHEHEGRSARREAGRDSVHHGAGSRVSAWAIATDEELMIARHAGRLLGLTPG